MLTECSDPCFRTPFGFQLSILATRSSIFRFFNLPHIYIRLIVFLPKSINIESTDKEKASCIYIQEAFQILVGPAGVEPTTNGLKVRCSTN